jgi:hypothetical protein
MIFLFIFILFLTVSFCFGVSGRASGAGARTSPAHVGSGRVPTQSAANLQWAAQPMSIRGLAMMVPHCRQRRFGSSLKNSTMEPQCGHAASKMSPGFQ